MKRRIANAGFISVIVAFTWVVAACTHAPNNTVDSASNNTVGLSQQAVAMPDSYSADAAMQVLQEGGNAIDAAITAQFVLAVTLPEAGNVGGGGFMTARGTANLLTRITTFLAAAFFLTSIGLAILAGNGRQSTSIVDEVIQSAPVIPETPTVPTEQ